MLPAFFTPGALAVPYCMCVMKIRAQAEGEGGRCPMETTHLFQAPPQRGRGKREPLPLSSLSLSLPCFLLLCSSSSREAWEERLHMRCLFLPGAFCVCAELPTCWHCVWQCNPLFVQCSAVLYNSGRPLEEDLSGRAYEQAVFLTASFLYKAHRQRTVLFSYVRASGTCRTHAWNCQTCLWHFCSPAREEETPSPLLPAELPWSLLETVREERWILRKGQEAGQA